MLLTLLLACSPAAKPPDADTQDSGDTVETAETGDTSGPLDADGDGVDATEDCADADPSVTAPSDWYPDEDQDGWGAVVWRGSRGVLRLMAMSFAARQWAARRCASSVQEEGPCMGHGGGCGQPRFRLRAGSGQVQ